MSAPGFSIPRPDHPIVFFDGVCGMCNQLVDAVLRADRKAIFRFAPVQGETARAMLPRQPNDPQAWSMFYLDEEGRLHDQSEAALQVCRRLGGIYGLLGLGLAVPRFLRDPIYRLIARNRYALFGKRATCRIPTREERDRFLP